MNQAEFNLVVSETVSSINKLLAVKGGEYANSVDRLANFKRGAALTGCTQLQVAFIYAAKHFDGIASYVKDPTRPNSEPIEGRFDDLINYCILMKGIVQETTSKPPEPVSGYRVTDAKDSSVDYAVGVMQK